MKRTVFISIHPYNGYGLYDKDTEFVRRRDARLADLKLEHILLIDKALPDNKFPDINVAKEKLNLDNLYWQNRIYFTHAGNYASKYPSNEELEFNKLSEIILQIFPADNYIFWGAELHKPPSTNVRMDETQKLIWTQRNHTPYGCVIYYSNILDLPNKFIDENHCLLFEW